MALIIPSPQTDSELFAEGLAGVRRASSYDLRIGMIIDEKGADAGARYDLRPGRMVHVISKEVFKLGHDVSGHVTYKTTMTQQGIWALTVGILDPGWDGPITTTLLNFSGATYQVQTGEKFLRVSFFRHEESPKDMLVSCGSREEYIARMQKIIGEKFPQTFLNTDEIAERARRKAVRDIASRSVTAAVIIAGALAVFTLFTQWLDRTVFLKDYFITADEAYEGLQEEVSDLRRRVRSLEERGGDTATQRNVRPN